MTIAAPQPAPAPRSRHGCLFGCLGALAIVALPVVLVSAYSAWFFYQGFRNDPGLRAVIELVRQDGMAEQVLGENIRITGVDGSALSFVPGIGTHSAYSVALTGSRASGNLAVESEIVRGRAHIETMILTGPDGTHYDLMHHTIAPGSNPTTSI
jgi:hypothetical protein